ncbi:adenosine deaminase [Aureococcus anophagefferens]|nr:adenosine deaminase [Aureococcus anophagefferens]
MDSLRERVRRFYARWNPENIGNVDNIVASFGDREEVLWEQLARKYGPDAVRLSAQEQLHASPGVRKAEDTFVLVDRQLLGHLRSTLLLADAPRRPPPQTQRCSAALATPFWQRAVQRADGLLKAACHVEDDALKRAAALARTDSFAAIRAVDARLAARPEGDRPGAPPRPDPTGTRRRRGALRCEPVQALGPESVGDADRGKLGDGDRDDALRVLGRVIRAAKRLDAATSKQKARLGAWLASVDRQLATPRAARVQAHPKRASPSYRRRREKRPRAEARAAEAAEPASDDDDDVVDDREHGRSSRAQVLSASGTSSG